MDREMNKLKVGFLWKQQLHVGDLAGGRNSQTLFTLNLWKFLLQSQVSNLVILT